MQAPPCRARGVHGRPRRDEPGWARVGLALFLSSHQPRAGFHVQMGPLWSVQGRVGDCTGSTSSSISQLGYLGFHTNGPLYSQSTYKV